MPATNPVPPNSKPDPAPVVDQVEGAHHLLKALRARIGEHPELTEAIVKLEMALSILTVNTAGML
jgi:hypothetical protein